MPPIVTSRPRRRLARAALLAGALLALVPAAAAADSIAYVKDSNVWIAHPDGSSPYQVTTDGTPSRAYGSPSQADDGRIAAAFGPTIRILKQNGAVLAEFDAPALTNSVSHPVDGTPYAVAFSPDGAQVAYSFANYECPIGADCTGREVTGFVDAAGTKLPGNLYHGHPAWISSSRLLLFGGAFAHINLYDVGQESDVNWLNDNETDLGDGVLSRDGRRLAAIRGYGDTSTVVWYDVPVDPRTGAPPKADTPTARCTVGPLKGIAGPTWSPDGNAIAWTEPDGIWTKTGVDDCAQPATALILPGAAEPDWGPADVNPGPRPGDEPPKDGPPKNDPGPIPPLDRTLAIRGRTPKLLTALKRGLKVETKNAPAGVKVVVTLSLDKKTAKRAGLGKKAITVATGTAKANAKGVATGSVRFTKKAAAKLKRLKTVTLTLGSAGAKAKAITLRR